MATSAAAGGLTSSLGGAIESNFTAAVAMSPSFCGYLYIAAALSKL